MMEPSDSPNVPADGFALPAGTVTFLLTDVEGSTLGWQESPEQMGPAIARHYEILDRAVAANGGVRPQEQGEGDSIVAAFSRASDALLAATEAQQALAAEPWSDALRMPIRVRMAIHTGEAQMRNNANYVGQAIIRTARLRAIAQGGQILVSQAARDLAVDQLGGHIEFLDLGLHRLKDLARPEHVWQVVVPGLSTEFPPLKSLDATPNNLPVDLSTFVGRQSEIAAVASLCDTNRLVVVTGTGGAGKTRLAQQVGAQMADQFEDGVWWIELAPLEPSAVLDVIAGVLRITEPHKIAEKLVGRTLLIVLDNCEHVLEVIAPLVHAIMAVCPRVRILATSRGPLDVPGEVTWRVPPLGLPTPGEGMTVETLAQFDAVRLFVDRAIRARPNFGLTTENGPAVAEICSRLDGIPLAIELAAARAKSLTPQQILAGLEDSLRLLTGGSRLVMPRQQTLEASIAWSYELLASSERTLLRRLSVFAGGWDLESAESICSDESLPAMDVLDALEHLIDQSLVRVDETGSVARYRLLETVRQYSGRLLLDSTESARLVRAHMEWFGRLARALGPLSDGPDEFVSEGRLVPERDNIAAALRAIQKGGDAIELAETVQALNSFWDHTDAGNSGVTWTSNALDLLSEAPSVLRARLLGALAQHHSLLGHFDRVMVPAQAALAMSAEVHDLRTMGRCRAQLGGFSAFFDPVGGMAMLEQGIDDCRSGGDLIGEISALNAKAFVHLFQSELVSARSVFQESGLLAHRLGQLAMLKGWHTSQAGLARLAGDHDAVKSHLAFAEGNGRVHPAGQALRLFTDVQTAADFGDEGPTVVYLQSRLQAFRKIDQPVAIMATNWALALAHHVRNEFSEVVAISETAGDSPLGDDGAR